MANNIQYSILLIIFLLLRNNNIYQCSIIPSTYYNALNSSNSSSTSLNSDSIEQNSSLWLYELLQASIADEIDSNSNSNNNTNLYPFTIVWTNPQKLPEWSLNNSNSLEMDNSFLARDGGDEDPGPHLHQFDEFEQRDLIRTVIYLANQQLQIKFKLCEIRRFRSEYRPQWAIYRCATRFTVTTLGKECHPETWYDGYGNFILQNPELPPLLSIRYYVFQFMYEAPYPPYMNKKQQPTHKINNHLPVATGPTIIGPMESAPGAGLIQGFHANEHHHQSTMTLPINEDDHIDSSQSSNIIIG